MTKKDTKDKEGIKHPSCLLETIAQNNDCSTGTAIAGVDVMGVGGLGVSECHDGVSGGEMEGDVVGLLITTWFVTLILFSVYRHLERLEAKTQRYRR